MIADASGTPSTVGSRGFGLRGFGSRDEEASVSGMSPAEPGAHALLGAREMQAVDARAIADGADGFALMRRAGEAVARHVRRLVPRGSRIAIVAGSGNNGGDGAVVAGRLREAGFERTTLIRAGGAVRTGSDAARAFDEWRGETLVVAPDAPDAADAADASEAAALTDDVRQAIDGADVVVDALLGAGLSRDVDGVFADLVHAMNAAGERGASLVAVDLPSGTDGDAHVVRGAAVRATLTVTFVRLKIVHCLYPGRALCGQVVVEDIGMPASALAAVLDASAERCHANHPSLWRDALPRPEATAHKFRRGHVLVRGGPVHQTGAARLTATTALGAGAGLVTLASARDAVVVNAAHLSAVMLRPCDTTDEWRALADDERIRALVVGPGNGVDAATAGAARVALASGRAVVLDADALTCHGALEKAGAAAFVDAMHAARATLVLTPHEGEFERLFGDICPDSETSRLHRARAAAASARAVVVLKGADTVVAAPDGRATINVDAPPWLATAGAGDVLAGGIAALLAQGMAPFEAASAAVWLHAEAARELGWPLTAERLAPAVGQALGRLVDPAPPPLPRLAFRTRR